MLGGSTLPAGAGGGSSAVASALASLDSFEVALKNGTRARREKEESRVSDLRSSIRDVENRLSEEAERHNESIRALQAWAESQAAGVRERLEAQVADAHTDAVARIAALNARVDALETKFEADKIATLIEVDRRNRELSAALASFAAEFEAEKVARAGREHALLLKMGAAELEARAAWDEERAAREQVYMGAKRRLEDAIAAREKGDGKFQSAVISELAAIKTSISAEAAARALEDDHLNAALAAYVAKLQASLALVNSEDARF
jgi:hypothetical protein